LWNKNKLRIDLKTYLEQSGRYLMLFDIDNLSTINLTHGRSYGDSLLKEVADLCESLEDAHAAYHVDHNYFAIILNACSEQEVCEIYKKIKDVMSDKCTFTASAVPIDKNLFYDETQLMDSVNMTLKKAKIRLKVLYLVVSLMQLQGITHIG
jgi:GGDEF domain-containing protein